MPSPFSGRNCSLIGKLRSIFNNAGRAGPWCDLLGTGNPASHHSLKDYLRFLYQEQASSHVSPKQSVPIFLDKLWKLCQHLNHLAYLSCDTAPLNRYIFAIARDLAFFCVDFFSGDRASDLGRTLTKEVLSLPDNQGFIFRQSVGKTFSCLRHQKVLESPHMPSLVFGSLCSAIFVFFLIFLKCILYLKKKALSSFCGR